MNHEILAKLEMSVAAIDSLLKQAEEEEGDLNLKHDLRIVSQAFGYAHDQYARLLANLRIAVQVENLRSQAKSACSASPTLVTDQ